MAQVSRRSLDPRVERRMFSGLMRALAHQSEAEVDQLLQDLLTETERVVVAKRLTIALLLVKGYSYTQVDKILKVSPPTIAKVKAWLTKGGAGLKSALTKVGDDIEVQRVWREIVEERPAVAATQTQSGAMPTVPVPTPEGVRQQSSELLRRLLGR